MEISEEGQTVAKQGIGERKVIADLMFFVKNLEFYGVPGWLSQLSI